VPETREKIMCVGPWRGRAILPAGAIQSQKPLWRAMAFHKKKERRKREI